MKIFNLKSLQRIKKHGAEVTTRDLLKAIAAISMILDHIGWLFMNHDPYLRTAGRLAAPVYFFLIGHSKHYPFSLQLLLYGIVVTAFMSFEIGTLLIDILISFLLVRFLLRYAPENTWRFIPLAVIFFFSIAMHLKITTVLSYGTLGLLWSICGVLKKNNNFNLNWFLPLTSIASIYFLIIAFNPPATPVFDVAYFVLFSLFTLIVFLFKIKPIEGLSKASSVFILFLSRYSLEIYVVHLCSFIALSRAF